MKNMLKNLIRFLKKKVNLIEQIKKHEGFEPTVYEDTEGYDTIGYGFAIKDLVLPGAPGMTSKPKMQTPPLPNTPMPAKMAQNSQQKDPQTNLTRTQTALLSPTEKVIAGKKI